MAKILVTGSNGQVGSEIRSLVSEYPDDSFIFTDRGELDITNRDAVENFIAECMPDVIVNCAAYTAVDKAESDRETADAVNHLAVRYMAESAKRHEVKLIHISTDYVFDGMHYRPYQEDDDTRPASVYGKTKLEGEEAMLAVNPSNSVIIRTSWVYSSFGANFVKTMLRLGNERDRLGVIFDQVGTPTYAKDLAQAVLDIIPRIHNDIVEIYHYSNEGVASWYDFAHEIMALAEIDCRIDAIETKEYPTPAGRPHFSLLNKSKIKAAFDLEIPYWKESLRHCLKKLGKNEL